MFLLVTGRSEYFFARFEQALPQQYPEKQITLTTRNFKFAFEMKSLENKRFKMQTPLEASLSTIWKLQTDFSPACIQGLLSTEA